MRERNGPPAAEQHVAHWTREGFAGDDATVLAAHHTPDYRTVAGPHAPHRLCLADVVAPDATDPAALPVPVLVARSGTRLGVSARAAPTPFVVSNVEADEVHFIQEGELEYVTAYGTLRAAPGTFVGIPRAVEYRIQPLRTPTRSLVLELPGAVRLEPAALADVPVARPRFQPAAGPGDETVLLVKAGEDVTRYVKPHDPLAAVAVVHGTPPVWRLDLADVAARLPALHGPPTPFARTRHDEELLYNLSASPRERRPPVHYNADYDEVVYYFRGPGAWGAVTEPGTLTWVPKGIAHHGPDENVPAGYLAFLLDVRSTLRLTPAGRAAATLMETGQYGRHPAAD